MKLKYEIKDLYTDGSHKVVGFKITDEAGKTLIIDKRIESNNSFKIEDYLEVARTSSLVEIESWQDENKFKGKIFLPDKKEIQIDNVKNKKAESLNLTITRRQCAIELRERGIISSLEALLMTKHGDMPEIIHNSFQLLSLEELVIVETDFADNFYSKNDLLIRSILLNLNFTENDIDQFFSEAATR